MNGKGFCECYPEWFFGYVFNSSINCCAWCSDPLGPKDGAHQFWVYVCPLKERMPHGHVISVHKKCKDAITKQMGPEGANWDQYVIKFKMCKDEKQTAAAYREALDSVQYPRLEDQRKCKQCRVMQQYKKRTLMICSTCKCALYCSAHCQKEDWKKGHKNECSKH